MNSLSAQAVVVAKSWGSFPQEPRLIGHRENAVFDCVRADGRRAALRIHRKGYQTRAAILSELLWTQMLAQTGFPCPAPIPSLDGELIATTPQGAFASLVTWIDAQQVGFGQPDELVDMCSCYNALGQLLRRLHETTDALALENLERPRWDRDALLGDSPLWGRFWENPALRRGEQETLLEARKNAAQQLLNIKDLDFGLIHADVLQENVLKDANGLHLIDFDDSGYGYRLYDLGTALIQHVEHPDLGAIAQALADGYGVDAEQLTLFTALRGFASCGWLMSRAAPDDPRHAAYAKRALTCVELLQAGRFR